MYRFISRVRTTTCPLFNRTSCDRCIDEGSDSLDLLCQCAGTISNLAEDARNQVRKRQPRDSRPPYSVHNNNVPRQSNLAMRGVRQSNTTVIAVVQTRSPTDLDADLLIFSPAVHLVTRMRALQPLGLLLRSTADILSDHGTRSSECTRSAPSAPVFIFRLGHPCEGQHHAEANNTFPCGRRRRSG